MAASEAITMIWGWQYICSIQGFYHRSSWFAGPDNSKKSCCDTCTKMFTRRIFESDGEFLPTIGFEQKTCRWSSCGVCTKHDLSTGILRRVNYLGNSVEFPWNSAKWTGSVTLSNLRKTPQNRDRMFIKWQPTKGENDDYSLILRSFPWLKSCTVQALQESLLCFCVSL